MDDCDPDEDPDCDACDPDEDSDCEVDQGADFMPPSIESLQS